MKAVISTTYSDTYLFFLPIVTWCWNKLGVGVICFLPRHEGGHGEKLELIFGAIMGMRCDFVPFDAPEHKQATYAQCSRLFGAALDLPEDEVLVTSDIDMAVFRVDFMEKVALDFFDVYGDDLVPEGQLPMCYVVGDVKTWRRFFTKGRTYHECLDAELAHEEMENMRGNLWCRDQELLKKYVGPVYFGHNRARPGTQFASNRYDRDDSYILERLSPDTIDYHMNRPGYEDGNFQIILQILQYHYPNEDFQWLIDYRNEYIKLL